MKPGKTLRVLTTAAALLAAAPSAQAEEQMTSDRRACIARVLMDPKSITHADVLACLTAEVSGDTDKAKTTLVPDSPKAKALFATLEARFQQESPVRPAGVNFADVKRSLEARPDLLFSLNEMEKTGGQPDVVDVEGNTFVFADVSAESPEYRRYLDYDVAKAMAENAGYEMMPKEVYIALQNKVRLDMDSCSWLLTDANMRATTNSAWFGSEYLLGFVTSYFATEKGLSFGFRGILRVPMVPKS